MGKSASGKDHIYARLAAHEELGLKKLVLYTTRPIRAEEEDGKQYYFVDDKKLKEFQEKGCVIEARAYHTVHGIWTYFTADDGQVNLDASDYLGIGTLESYVKMREYYGEEALCPIYIEVEDGERLARALNRERSQKTPRYEEMCRRFLQIRRIFPKKKLLLPGLRKDSRISIWKNAWKKLHSISKADITEHRHRFKLHCTHIYNPKFRIISQKTMA